MASLTQRPFAGKQLGQLLQDQQEPFTLDVYLVEKGFLKRSVSSALNKRRIRAIIPGCSKILRAVFNKIIFVNLRMKNPESRDQSISVTKRRRHENAERYSSASGTTVFNSCSESDTEYTYVSWQKQVATDRKSPSGSVEDNKQLSPISVLEGILCDDHTSQHKINARQEEASTVLSLIKTKKATSDSVFSDPVGKLPDSTPVEKQKKNVNGVNSDPSSQYGKIKMALQQTKQLLFDCVREVVESHHTRRQQLGPNEIGKTLNENIWAWSKQAIHGTNPTQLLNLDFLASAHEWTDLKQQKKEIAREVGDVILEDVLTEIVTDMM